MRSSVNNIISVIQRMAIRGEATARLSKEEPRKWDFEIEGKARRVASSKSGDERV